MKIHSIFPNYWSHSLCPRCRGSTQLHWASMPGITIFSHQIPTLVDQNRSSWWILFGCREWCGGVSIVGSLPSSSIVSLQRTQNSASLISLDGRVQVHFRLCSTTIFGLIDHMNIYTETYIMHAISWCSESCDCNKDNYDKTKHLVAV